MSVHIGPATRPQRSSCAPSQYRMQRSPPAVSSGPAGVATKARTLAARPSAAPCGQQSGIASWALIGHVARQHAGDKGMPFIAARGTHTCSAAGAAARLGRAASSFPASAPSFTAASEAGQVPCGSSGATTRSTWDHKHDSVGYARLTDVTHAQHGTHSSLTKNRRHTCLLTAACGKVPKSNFVGARRYVHQWA